MEGAGEDRESEEEANVEVADEHQRSPERGGREGAWSMVKRKVTADTRYPESAKQDPRLRTCMTDSNSNSKAPMRRANPHQLHYQHHHLHQG